MEEILDQQNNDKDERWINSITSIARLLLNAYFLYVAYHTWFIDKIYESSAASEIMYILIISIIMLGLVMYNFKRIQTEILQKSVVPYFKKEEVAVYIVLNLIFLDSIFDGQLYSEYNHALVEKLTYIALGAIIILIIVREIIYFTRTTHLKRHKNAKP